MLVTLMNGKRPFVVPRRAHYGEAVDDHQLELGEKLHEIGLVTLVMDPATLPSLLGRGSVGESVDHAALNPLVADLQAYIGGATDPPDGTAETR